MVRDNFHEYVNGEHKKLITFSSENVHIIFLWNDDFNLKF